MTTEIDDELPFEIISIPDTDTVRMVRCTICKDAIFDERKDKGMLADSLTKVTVLHLALRHGDRFEIVQE